MAVPVINTTTSVLGYLQWESWAYQPYATNTPTSWSSTPLPPGMSLNSSTGRISGAATSAGVYLVALTATNGDGAATPLVLTIGIGAAEAALTSSAIDLSVDVLSREVTVASTKGLFSKEGDDAMFAVKFKKAETVLDLPITDMQCILKEFDSETGVSVSDGFAKRGTGTGTYYLLHLLLDRTKLAGVLSGYEDDKGTQFKALAEIEWVETNADEADLGPSTLRQTTKNFDYEIARELGEVS